MKRLTLVTILSLLCFVSKAQSKDTLIELHTKVVKYDKLYSKLMHEALYENKDVDPDYAARVDSLRIAAHDDYNYYWSNYHAAKGDLNQKVSESITTYERNRRILWLMRYFFL